MLRVQFEPAYLLSRKAYKEESALIELFTQQHGLVRLVARGVRRKRSSLGACLQPFQPLLVSWQAKTELGTLTAAELSSSPFILAGDRFLAGNYLNELLSRLLTHSESVQELFIHYAAAIAQLAHSDASMELILRVFEYELLEELGYSLAQQEWLMEDYYQWHAEHGLIRTEQPGPIQGKHLYQIEQRQLTDAAVLKAAKFLARQRLAPLLGERPLKSRDVWLQMKRGSE